MQKKIKNLKKIVEKEFMYFQEEKIKGKYIQIYSIFDFLLISRPTSVESEKAFFAD